MSKPLRADPALYRNASKFHRDVFDTFAGPKRICALCGRPGAVDAAHVIPRSKLGPLRYADVQFARPAHRECHEAQERGEVSFSLDVRRQAIWAHNRIAKVKLPEPA